MTLTSLQKLIQRTEALIEDDERYRRQLSLYGLPEPVHPSEILDLILTLAREIDDIRQHIPGKDSWAAKMSAQIVFPADQLSPDPETMKVRCDAQLAGIKGDDEWATKMRAQIRAYWFQPEETADDELQ